VPFFLPVLTYLYLFDHGSSPDQQKDIGRVYVIPVVIVGRAFSGQLSAFSKYKKLMADSAVCSANR
jgi:hypothetical protein